MHEAFFNSIKEIILKNIEDEHFGVSELASEMGLSRSQLLRKVKSSTGSSTNNLLREIRLIEAAKLIKEGKHTISEISYLVGFSSPSYFNKCFHEHFKTTPGEFNEKNIKIQEKEFELGLMGNKHSSFSSRLTISIISLAIILIAIFIFNKFIYNSNNSQSQYASIAVLPFLNLSENQNQDYLADGITEAITLELSKRKAIRVISRTSAMRYKNEKKLSSDIAKELDVGLLVEGSLLHSSDSLRIVVQLIEPTPNEKHVWSNCYDQKYTDVLQLVANISNEIAQEINLVIFPSEKGIKEKKTTAEAYDLYLKGRHLLNQQNSKSVIRSVEYIKESIKLDSSFAPAYATLAEIYISLNKLIRDNNEKVKHREKSRIAIKKALELDNTLGAAFITKGNILGKFDWDWKGMKEMVDKGLKLDPNNSYGHILLSKYYLIKGEYKLALAEALVAEKLDPVNPRTGCLLADRYYMADEYEKAIIEYEKVLELFPNYGFAWNGLGYVQFITGQKDKAIRSWQKLQVIMGNDSIAQHFSIASYEESLHFWLQKAKSKSPQYCSNPCIIAQAHMFLDEKSEALEYLEIAYKYRNEDLPIILIRPHFKPLHTETRFMALIKKVGVSINN